jgi:hypothetical protein
MAGVSFSGRGTLQSLSLRRSSSRRNQFTSSCRRRRSPFGEASSCLPFEVRAVTNAATTVASPELPNAASTEDQNAIAVCDVVANPAPAFD